MKDAKLEHEQMRKQLWLSAWVATASADNCTRVDVATTWADDALKAFDARFPAPAEGGGEPLGA